MEHTSGKLHVGTPNMDDGIQAHGLHSDDFIVADVYMDMTHGLSLARENARRLVACWNAFDGVSTDAVESFLVKETTQFMHETVADRDRLRDECERLKEAITKIESEFAPGDARKLYASPDDALHRIRNIARAALRPADAKDTQ